MARSKDYQRLLNSKTWRQHVRPDYLRRHPLCERCLAEGKVVAAVDVHHIVPVESAHTQQEMARLAYNLDGNNLQALCIPCHIQVHQEMRSHTAEGHQQRQADRLEQWKEKQRKPRAGHFGSG